MADIEVTPDAAVQSSSIVRHQFAIERIEDCWLEALPLIYANQLETGEFDPEKFSPPRELYVKADRDGRIVLYTMRDATTGALVGYQVFQLVESHPRYLAIPLGIQDVAYVTPEHRGPAVLEFFRFADDNLRSRGMKPIRHSSGRRDITSLLAHLGYHKIEETWLKD